MLSLSDDVRFGLVLAAAMLGLAAASCAGRSHVPHEDARGSERDAAKAVDAEQATPAEDAPEVLDAAAVRRVVEAGEHAVQACYQSWLDLLMEEERLDPSSPPGGRMLLTFGIGAEGRVVEAEVTESEMHGDVLERCVLAEIRRWRFPAPGPGEAPVFVEAPFFFEPRME